MLSNKPRRKVGGDPLASRVGGWFWLSYFHAGRGGGLLAAVRVLLAGRCVFFKRTRLCPWQQTHFQGPAGGDFHLHQWDAPGDGNSFLPKAPSPPSASRLPAALKPSPSLGSLPTSASGDLLLLRTLTGGPLGVCTLISSKSPGSAKNRSSERCWLALILVFHCLSTSRLKSFPESS